jgi:DNA gyrase subunit A
LATLAEALNYARQSLSADQFAEAEGVYLQLVAAVPQMPDLWHELGIAQLQSGKTDAAIASLERAVSLDGANAAYFSNLGAAYVTRFNDVPASTGYGDPVQKLFKFDDNERIVGALSLDGRLSKPEKLIAVTKDGLGLRFALEGHTEVSTRSGRRYAKTGEGDEIIGVQPVGEKDLLAVLTDKTSALVCKANEVNELQGPGKGVMVIKVEESDRVVEFLAVPPTQKDKVIEFETQKGRKLSLNPGKYEVTGRGGKGKELMQRGGFTKVVPGEVAVPILEGSAS